MQARTPVILLLAFFLASCGSSSHRRGVTVAQVQALESFESGFPITSDSVIARFQRYDEAGIRKRYARQLDNLVLFIDSLNTILPAPARVDTLALDHSFENIGTAAYSGRTIYLSSSYFFLYDNEMVVRSVVRHEFGHILYQHFASATRQRVDSLWSRFSGAALLYLFHEGEYSDNARFGGHPYDSPAEFFASAFNLLNSRREEFEARCRYVDQKNVAFIESLKTIVDALSHSPR
jgi:hypothetical protein